MKVQFNSLVFVLISLIITGNAFGQQQPITTPQGPTPLRPTKTTYCPYQPQEKNTNPQFTRNVYLSCITEYEKIEPDTYYVEINAKSISINFKEGSSKSKSTSTSQSYLSQFPETKAPGAAGSTVPPAINMALNQVFSAVADMAVTRAKNLALELAKDQVIKACENTKLNTTIPTLCKKFKEVPLLDLIRDRKMLVDAIVSDALNFLGKYQRDPGRFQLAIKILSNHLLQMSTTSIVDSKEVPNVVVRQLYVLEGLLSNFPSFDCSKAGYNCQRLNSVLILSQKLLQEAKKVGFDKKKLENILEWSIFRDFTAPNEYDKKYSADYEGLLLFTNNLINGACDSAPVCKKEYIQSLNLNNFTFNKFVKNHPEFVLQLEIWNDIKDNIDRYSDTDLSEFKSWFSRFRAILAESDPKIQLKNSFALFMDVLIEIQRSKTIESEIDAAKMLVQDLQKLIDAKKNIEELPVKINDANKEMKAADAAVKELTDKLDAVKKKMEAAVAVVNELTDKLKDAEKKKKTAAEANVKELTDKLTAAETEKTAAEANVKELTDKLTAAETEKTAAITKVKELTDKLTAEKTDLDEKKSAAEANVKELTVKLTAAREAQYVAFALTKQLTKKLAIAKMMSEDKNLKSNLAKAFADVQVLTEKHEAAKKKALDLKQRNQLSTIIAELKKKIEKSDDSRLAYQLAENEIEDNELTEIVKVAELESTKLLVLAIVEKDYAGILRSFIDLMQYIHVDNADAVKKGMATLRLIIGLVEKDAEGEKPEEAQKRRVKLLEEFADRMTSRKGRIEQHIFSLGVSTLLGFGYYRQKPEDEEVSNWNPVLSIPLGVSYEYYWSKCRGIHVMVYPLDVAQYARVQTEEKSTPVPEPSFYTALTFGGQIAYSLLVKDTPVTIGFDARYIPALEYTLTNDAGLETKTQARHIQFMLFVGFHFPLLDFN